MVIAIVAALLNKSIILPALDAHSPIIIKLENRKLKTFLELHILTLSFDKTLITKTNIIIIPKTLVL